MSTAQISRRLTQVGQTRSVAGSATIAFVCALAMAPLVLGSYPSAMLAKMMIYGIFAIGLNLLVGYTGIASLGHAAFFGTGGYVIAILSRAGVDGFFLPLAVAIAASTVLAMAFACLTLRSTGPYQLMITLALSQVLWGAAYSWRAVSGGDDGIPGIRLPFSIFGSNAAIFFYGIVLSVFAMVLIASRLLVYSPFGRSMIGIRENGSRMRALGFNVWLHKFIACAISGALAGLAGALLAWQNGFVGPGYLSVTTSALVLIMVIFGGAGTVAGPVIGAFILIGLENVVSAITDRWVLVLGLIYILTSLFAPQGLVGLFRAMRGNRP
ncbi:branched-chain amino acid ABC transporter permease [Bradyrhizobium sp. TM239]|uniref:branched-chain amino acid ABC transporter permease n=1 Tax=Bradyrhizobium sp. TM239 TaxID=2599802 RepID=UPI0030C74FDC